MYYCNAYIRKTFPVLDRSFLFSMKFPQEPIDNIVDLLRATLKAFTNRVFLPTCRSRRHLFTHVKPITPDNVVRLQRLHGSPHAYGGGICHYFSTSAIDGDHYTGSTTCSWFIISRLVSGLFRIATVIQLSLRNIDWLVMKSFVW